MKILLLADFRSDSSRFMLNNSRMFSKGFVRNGHDVMEFNYRRELLQLSPFGSRKWAVKFAKKKTDQHLVHLARHYQPDLIFITAFKLLDHQTVESLREAAPQAVTMCWYGDPPRGIDNSVTAIAKRCDWFLATSGGQLLQEYKQMGIPHCAFIPNPSDKDIEYPADNVPAQWKSSLLFTGKLTHHRPDVDPERTKLIEYLAENKGMTLWGCLGRPEVRGADYLHALWGADMILSINICNDVRFYHSDRLIHALACGGLVLAKRVPDTDLLFEHEKHLCYFDTMEQCLELVDHYTRDDQARKKIADAGMNRAYQSFSCEKLAAHVIELAQTGTYQESWAEIL